MTVHKIFNGLMNKGYLIERVLFEELKRRILDRTKAKDVELYDCTLMLGKHCSEEFILFGRTHQ